MFRRQCDACKLSDWLGATKKSRLTERVGEPAGSRTSREEGWSKFGCRLILRVGSRYVWCSLSLAFFAAAFSSGVIMWPTCSPDVFAFASFLIVACSPWSSLWNSFDMHGSLSPRMRKVVTDASAFGRDFVALDICLHRAWRYGSYSSSRPIAGSDLPNADRISTVRRRLAKQVGITMRRPQWIRFQQRHDQRLIRQSSHAT